MLFARHIFSIDSVKEQISGDMKDIFKKFNKVLNKKQKSRVVVLIFMILIGAVLETLGVSMIYPLIETVMMPEVFEQNAMIVWICNVLGYTSAEQFVTFMLLALIFIFIFKNLYLLLLYYVQHSFITNSQYRISRDLLKVYLNRPYEFYLNASTGDIMRTVYSDSTGIFNLLLQCMQFITEFMVAIFLGTYLLIIDPVMTIVMGVLLVGITLISSAFLKPRISRIGEESRQQQSKMYKTIMQSINSVKDVKVYGKEDAFLGIYRKYGKRYYNLARDHEVLSSVPRLAIEAFSLSGVLAYMAVMMKLGQDVQTMVPQLSAFAVAAVRLLPSASRINTYLANIAYYRPTLDYVYANVELPKNVDERAAEAKAVTETDKLKFHDCIKVEQLYYKYPNTDKYIFENARMQVPYGKSVGIMGPSGAGKTTVVDIILGLLKAESGQITCDGVNVLEHYGQWLANIGYISQTINMVDDTIRANIAFGVDVDDIDDARVWQVLEEAQLADFVRNLPNGINTVIGERGVRISGGQRQRVGIARALYHDPEILILDEATSALDNDTEAAIMEAIENFHGRKTMLIIAHRLKTIENCDIIYKVENGKITESSL